MPEHVTELNDPLSSASLSLCVFLRSTHTRYLSLLERQATEKKTLFRGKDPSNRRIISSGDQAALAQPPTIPTEQRRPSVVVVKEMRRPSLNLPPNLRGG